MVGTYYARTCSHGQGLGNLLSTPVPQCWPFRSRTCNCRDQAAGMGGPPGPVLRPVKAGAWEPDATARFPLSNAPCFMALADYHGHQAEWPYCQLQGPWWISQKRLFTWTARPCQSALIWLLIAAL